MTSRWLYLRVGNTTHPSAPRHPPAAGLATVAVIANLLKNMFYPGPDPLRGLLADAELGRELIGGLEADPADVAGQAGTSPSCTCLKSP